MLRQDDFQRSQLVLTGWRFGHTYGGHLPACLIMSCIATRVRAGWGNWLDVIDNIPKYSATLEQPTGTPQIWEPQFVRLLHEVGPIFDGSQDYAKGAMYWCDTRYIETPFFKEKILGQLDQHPRIGEMGSLCLFR